MNYFYCDECDEMHEQCDCVQPIEGGLQCPACGEEVEDADYSHDPRDPIREAVDAALLDVIQDIARGLHG